MIKKGWLLVVFLFIFMGFGCSVRQQWQIQLWQSENPSGQTPEIGKLQTDDLDLGVLVTEFREVIVIDGKKQPRSPALVSISISCRNNTAETFVLDMNPIQVVNGSHELVKPLSLDHVMYKLYGGNLREQQQRERLAEVKQPLVSSGSSVWEDILTAVVNVYRAEEYSTIVGEMLRKEASLYSLYYQSFSPTSLPPGVSTRWTDFFPYTSDKVTVILEGQRVEDGVTFEAIQEVLARLEQEVPTRSKQKDGVPGGVKAVIFGAIAVPLVVLAISSAQ